MDARAKAPPAAPPAMAATGTPLSGCFECVAGEGAMELVGVEELVEAPVA